MIRVKVATFFRVPMRSTAGPGMVRLLCAAALCFAIAAQAASALDLARLETRTDEAVSPPSA